MIWREIAHAQFDLHHEKLAILRHTKSLRGGFVFWMHFIKPVYAIQNFNEITAVILIVVTTLLGFVVGSVFALLWNWIHRA